MTKNKKVTPGKINNAVDCPIDLAPMREHIDSLKKDIAGLPEGKLKTSLFTKVENLYFSWGNYFRDFAAGVKSTASAGAEVRGNA